MSTSLSTIRFDSEQVLPQGALDDTKVVKWCNQAQNDFRLQIFIAGSTTQLLDTTSLSYTLSPTTIRTIRRMRLQSDIDNHINRSYNPVYTLYNGVFEVPTPFTKIDTLLIDYYKELKTFTSIDDLIDLDDRFMDLYTSYIEAQFYLSPMGQEASPARGRYVPWQLLYNQYSAIYETMKKQVTDFYTNAIGIQKPNESGW